MASEKNHMVFLNERPGANGEPAESHFGYRECGYPSEDLAAGQVLIRTCYLSVDPALRCLMNDDSGVEYMKAWQLGAMIHGSSGVGIVIKSNHPDYSPGDTVEAVMGWPWVEYFNQSIDVKDFDREHTFQKLDRWSLFGAKPSLALSVLVGLTALIGLWEKGHVQSSANQTLVVSGAAGATGSFAGQMGRLLGCSNVVGICGSDDKGKWVVDELGYDAAINYKTDDVTQKLQTTCPDGVDVYFDNVGGDISDKVIRQMKKNSHVVLCGQISQYNKDVPYPPPLPQVTLDTLKHNNITRERFLVLNYKARYNEALQYFINWIMTGELKYEETITKGLESAPKAFISMMSGGNRGKQIVHISDTTL